jgi:hypothetical protein
LIRRSLDIRCKICQSRILIWTQSPFRQADQLVIRVGKQQPQVFNSLLGGFFARGRRGDTEGGVQQFSDFVQDSCDISRPGVVVRR